MSKAKRQAGWALGAALAFLSLALFLFVLPRVTALEYSAGTADQAGAALGVPAPPPVIHLSTPVPVRALYVTSWVAATPTLRQAIIKLAEETEVNALVIDVKDYTGRIAFAVEDRELKALGSADGRIVDLTDLVHELHQKNIYLIARIAVFQDPYLAAARPELAVKKKSDGAVWQDYKGAKWVDPASREVWDYTVAIAREAYRVGFDELNFDYVRFPSDGNIRDLKYPFFDETKTTKAESLRRFFNYLHEELLDLKVPLSVDLFGMTTTNTDDLNIGQVLELAAPYFDFIAPMVYPSHYPPGFLHLKNPAAAPYEVIKHSLDAAVKRLTVLGLPVQLRPWLQDFDLGATYTSEMIRKEKQAAYDAGVTGWMMWSPSNQYTVGALDI